MGVLAVSGFIIVMAILVCVLFIIAGWKIFSKAGEGGWKSLIPIYNGYITYKIAWKGSMFWVNLALTVAASLLGGAHSWVRFIGWGCAIADFIFIIMLFYRLAKAFGHGVGYTLGLIFLPNVFTLILGFGGDEYVGPQK